MQYPDVTCSDYYDERRSSHKCFSWLCHAKRYGVCITLRVLILDQITFFVTCLSMSFGLKMICFWSKQICWRQNTASGDHAQSLLGIIVYWSKLTIWEDWEEEKDIKKIHVLYLLRCIFITVCFLLQNWYLFLLVYLFILIIFWLFLWSWYLFFHLSKGKTCWKITIIIIRWNSKMYEESILFNIGYNYRFSYSFILYYKYIYLFNQLW